MQKKIAIAVDASMHSSHAVQYAVRMAASIPELQVVLIHIQPTLSGYLLDEARQSVKAEKELQQLIRKNQAAAVALLEEYRQRMVESGMPEDRIELKTQLRHISVADDLLAWCQVSAYDALMVGRRGVSYLQGLVMGSVTENLVNHSNLTPIWIIDGKIDSEKILLAVDGSPRALRAVDYLSFMLSGSEKSRIHMLHIQPRMQDYCEINVQLEVSAQAESILLDSDRKCLDDFHAQALTVFKRNGFSRDRIDLHIVPNKLAVGKAILDEARRGNFGTIVIGKRGESKSMFFGSVSRHVIQKAADLAVWIVP
ncbi:universal stress protein [Desulfosarcina sp.]|uniref:universal stress protein n=1 Tax=Desulfosarcina sp. TaxID=2027861 RepID=UPI003970DA7A